MEYQNNVVLGAGGAISRVLLPELRKQKRRIVLVSRSGHPVEGSESLAADISDYQALSAAVPSQSVIYLLAGLAYDIRVWREQWPRIMDNVIRVCSEKESLLVFFDNVYMYGLVDGPMTESTPHKPISKKGEVRAQIADRLINEYTSGRLQGLIARSADFYGPSAGRNGIPNVIIIQRMIEGKDPQWIGSSDKLHSLTYTGDCGRALTMLVQDSGAHNQLWHLPTGHPPITMRGFAELAAAILKREARIKTLPAMILRLAGLFDRTMRELPEMLYQNTEDYVFDSTKFEEHFSFAPTSYEEGISQTIRQITD